MNLYEKSSKVCIKVSNWFAHPIAVLLFPAVCVGYQEFGGSQLTLTLILSIMSISLTQMVLRAQEVDAMATKLQIAEIVKALPKANNEVIREDLTLDEINKLKKETDDAISNKV